MLSRCNQRNTDCDVWNFHCRHHFHGAKALGPNVISRVEPDRIDERIFDHNPPPYGQGVVHHNQCTIDNPGNVTQFLASRGHNVLIAKTKCTQLLRGRLLLIFDLHSSLLYDFRNSPLPCLNGDTYSLPPLPFSIDCH